VKVLERTVDIPDEPMNLNLTGFVGTPGDAFTRGGPDATTPWYVDMTVDWVRIWTPEEMLPGELPATVYGAPNALAAAPESVRTGVREMEGVRYAASWNAGEWGSVPVARSAPDRWRADTAERLAYANYETVDLDLSAAGARALDILAIGARGGSIETGRGPDRVAWVAQSDAGGAGNRFDIRTGGGADEVLVTSAGASSLDQPFGWGARWNGGYAGRYSLAVVNGGPGDDAIAAESQVRLIGLGGGGRDRIEGGGRGDLIVGGLGDDDLAGGGGRDVFRFQPGHGDDRIADFASGQDVLRLVGVSPGSVWTEPASDASGDWGVRLYYGDAGDTVFLSRVTGISQGDIVFA